MQVIPLLILGVVLDGFVAWFIAIRLYRLLKKNESPWAGPVGFLGFLAVFALVFFILFQVLSSIHFER